ncbi:MAG: hypothetical protein JO306_07850 [Gemmatimonadetes bacterium]|nr:hypothetical protein [Gemmatimonadota bacterium]
MGLFDRHDYGRDYGGHSLGDRVRGAWYRFEDRMYGGGRGGDDRDFGRGGWNRPDARYDRDMSRGNRGRQGGGYDASDFAYRGMDGAWSTARNRGAHDVQWDWRAAGGSRYDQDTSRGRGGGYDRGYSASRGMDRGYDRDMPRHVDADDPFGDRQGRTPFRVMRGGFDRESGNRGGWFHAGGGRDPDDVRNRGWNRGIGDEPAYRPEDFRGWDNGRGRDGRWGR